MKNKNKVVRFDRIGPAEVLEIHEEPERLPIADEVLLDVDAFALNRADVMFRTGNYLEYPQFPSRLGYEASGTVKTVGPNVQTIKVGDKVSTVPAFSMGEYGVYGNSAIVPEHAIAKYPDNLSSLESTSIWMTYITAYGALIEIGNIQEGDVVLLTAATSAVGLAAIEIAKSRNAKCIAVTRTTAKAEFLSNHGADFVIALENENLVERIGEITDARGVDLVFDPIAGELLEQLAQVTKPGGTIIEYGALASEPTKYPLFTALGKGLKIQGYTLFEITKDKDSLERAKSYVYQGLKKNIFSPIIDRTFKLEEIVEAHKYMESNEQKGKIVITNT